MVEVRLSILKIFKILVSLECFWYSSAIQPLLGKNDPRPLCACSNVRKSISTRVVGGHAAGQKQFPFATALLPNYSMFRDMNPPTQIRPYCGATLITDRHVITAAHCIRDRTNQEIMLDVSDYNLNTNTDNKILREVLKLTKHPGYVKKTFNNDIGIIEFDGPIQFNNNVKAVWLPAPHSDLKTGTTVTVYGWGRLEYHGGNPDALNTVDLPIVDKATCQEVYVSKITENMICAGGKYHEDACLGDSGSGLTTRLDDEYALVGVVSFGKKCGLKYVPGIYTKVSNYVEWIYNQTRDASCQPCIASPDE